MCSGSHILNIDLIYGCFQETAEDIRMTIGQAFEICYQKVMRAKRLSQERRTSGGSPMSSPVH